MLTLLLVAFWLTAGSTPALAREAEPNFSQRQANTAARDVGPPAAQSRARVLAADELPAAHLWLARPFAPQYQLAPAVTFPYGSTGGGRYVLHTGIDIGNPMSTPVLAMAEGVVVYAGDDRLRLFGPKPSFYGNLVVVQLTRTVDRLPVYVLYGHLDEVRVMTGQRVDAGDMIGAVGMTGIAIGPHLHVEVRVGRMDRWHTLNPELWLAPLPGAGTVAGRVLTLDGAPVTDATVYLYRGDALWRIGATYPAEETINSDPAWQENFVLSDIPAGNAQLVVRDGARNISLPIRVRAGELTFVEFRIGG
ncbi:MAG: Glycyl-glycine endopeptidase LytM precursor [Chloroflexi bacterium ADurb.Bin325]|nr:MAG: Glycyl-glycine endopeptidase LytM precursor [Chloroflexi bacterium ADurb.Bin325]